MVPKMWNKLVIPLTRNMTESIPLHHPPVRLMSTIYALSSGHGKCGVSLIRVSGPAAMSSLQALTLQNEVGAHKPRKATLNKIVSPKCGTMIDHALTIWFPGPNSFTGTIDNAEKNENYVYVVYHVLVNSSTTTYVCSMQTSY